MSFRMEKVNSEIQQALSKIINNEIRNPELDDLVLTIVEVKTSADFSQAKVFVSALNGFDKQNIIINELNNSASFIRKNLAQQLNLKRTPKLIFIYDNSLTQGANVLKLIEKISNDKK